MLLEDHAQVDDVESTTIKVLVADDHPLLLAGLRRMLEEQDGIAVVGQAQSGRELVGLVERRRPDVVLTDLRMPGTDGFSFIAAIRERWPSVKVVVLSASGDADSVDGALGAGACCFVIKTTAPTDVAAVIRQVHGGSIFHARPRSVPATSDRTPADHDGPDLTGRERTILAAVACGKTTACISTELWVSEHTIKFHLTNIYRKLGVPNRAAAVRYALEHDITDA